MRGAPPLGGGRRHGSDKEGRWFEEGAHKGCPDYVVVPVAVGNLLEEMVFLRRPGGRW